MTAPIDAVSGLVEELRNVLTDWNGADLPDAESPRVDVLCGTLRHAADALEAQARELAEARVFRINATSNMRAMKGRIAALEDAVRVFADKADFYDAIPLPRYFGGADPEPFRAPDERPTAVMVTVGDLRRARTALAKGQNALASGREDDLRNPAYDGPMGIFEGYGEEP